MIDGIKTHPINIPDQCVLEWHISVNKNDGEIFPKSRANFKGLLFTNIRDKIYLLEGSLHKFYNNGYHNYNNYTFGELRQTLNQLKWLFDIDPAKVFLSNLEFGVNITLPYPPDTIINSLVMHKTETFKQVSYNYTRGKSPGIVECTHSNYWIKIYDKGKQNNLNQNILRIEIKAKKMTYFESNKIPIRTLADLLNIENLRALGRLLVEMINDCLFVDPRLLSQENIEEKDQLILARGSIANNWNQLKPESKNFEKGNKDPEYNRTRKRYYKELSKFESLLKKFGSDQKEQLSQLVEDKFNELLAKTEISKPLTKWVQIHRLKKTNSTN